MNSGPELRFHTQLNHHINHFDHSIVHRKSFFFQVTQIEPGIDSDFALLETGNRFAHLVPELDLTSNAEVVITLVGGGDQEGEASSPPKKKRCRGKGRSGSLGRRRKTSRVSTERASENSGDEKPGPSKTADRIAAWKKSPQGKLSIAKSNKKYRMKEKSAKLQQEASRRYESTEKAKSTRHSYESEHGQETRRRYESEHGQETRRRYESEHGQETRRRYMSAEGRETREQYRLSEAGKEATKRYKDSELGREAQTKSRKKYELKEAAKKRKLRYNRRVAYNKSVKKAVSHLAKRAAEAHPADSNDEHQFFDEQARDEPSEHSEPGAEEFLPNSKAMTEIRSHLVS